MVYKSMLPLFVVVLVGRVVLGLNSGSYINKDGEDEPPALGF